jgi:hypothetical protein
VILVIFNKETNLEIILARTTVRGGETKRWWNWIDWYAPVHEIQAGETRISALGKRMLRPWKVSKMLLILSPPNEHWLTDPHNLVHIYFTD